MITILVAAILAAVALPSVGNFINQTRLSGNVNEFIAATMLARSEAIQRAGAVTICRSSGAETGSDSCDQRSSDWSSGWLIYVGTAADSPNTAGHQILARQGAFAAGTSIAAASAATAITYAASGAPWPAPPGAFTFTFNNNFLRKVCFSPSGRISTLPAGADVCPA
ncbi:GspH/FimT family protein [Collimonas sp.]|uniref:GspH/FimT family protein n=1 Tax=Collimonas sp. TaxID=1963772 RepID=UPI0037BE76E3